MPNSRPPQGPPSFSTAHLARRLGVSVPTVQRWVDLGHLRAWKTVGGHRRIDAESAEAFIRMRMQQRGGDSGEPVAPFSVLVVEASAIQRELLCALVELALPGARVIVAPNGFDALIEVGKAMPDLIVTDITMPHMDGVEMIRHLSNQGDGGTRPSWRCRRIRRRTSTASAGCRPASRCCPGRSSRRVSSRRSTRR